MKLLYVFPLHSHWSLDANKLTRDFLILSTIILSHVGQFVVLSWLRVADAVPGAALTDLLRASLQIRNLGGDAAAGGGRPDLIQGPLDGDEAAVAAGVGAEAVCAKSSTQSSMS